MVGWIVDVWLVGCRMDGWLGSRWMVGWVVGWMVGWVVVWLDVCLMRLLNT